MKPTKAVYSDGYSSEQSGAEERTGTGANGGHGWLERLEERREGSEPVDAQVFSTH